MTITVTIGCTAEVMRVRTVASPTAREQAGRSDPDQPGSRARAGRPLDRARLLERRRGAGTGDRAPAGSDTDPHRSPALQTWRIIGPTDPGIDGAVSRWESAATETITNPRLVTQLALHLAAADIALVCASASAVMCNGADTGALSDAPQYVRLWSAPEDPGDTQHAGPPNYVLADVRDRARQASADLRQHLDDTLRTRSTGSAPTTCSPRSADQLVAVLHLVSSQPSASGQAGRRAFDGLAHGSSRVWLNASQIPTPRVTQRGMDGTRYEWLPDPAGFHSAEGLHHDSAEAVVRLVHATP